MEEREILYRGQDLYSDKWYYGFYYKTEHDIAFIKWQSKGTCFQSGIVKSETVGQFTGLYDSTKWEDLTEEERIDWTRQGNLSSKWKGKMIFEGDIQTIDVYHSGGVTANVPDLWNCLVRWDNILARYVWQEVEHKMLFIPDEIARKKTIGNKTDNPELLSA